jgi:hypothetical protein
VVYVLIRAEESKSFTPVFVKDGLYTATVGKLRELVIDERETLAIEFKLDSGESIDGLCSKHLSQKSKLWKWCEMLGIKITVGQLFDPEAALPGKRCRVLLASKERTNQDGSKYMASYVKEVLPM